MLFPYLKSSIYPRIDIFVSVYNLLVYLFICCDMVKHELRVTSCELRVESLKARVEIRKCEFKFTSYKFKSTSYEFSFIRFLRSVSRDNLLFYVATTPWLRLQHEAE